MNAHQRIPEAHKRPHLTEPPPAATAQPKGSMRTQVHPFIPPTKAAGLERSAAFRQRQGFSLVELIVVVAVLGVLLGIGALNLRPLSGDLQNDANLVAGIFKQARVKSVATTSGYRIVKVSDTRLVAEYSNTCSGTVWTEDTKLGVALEHDARIAGENGTLVCFSSKGTATSNPTVSLSDDEGKTARVEVFLGGSVEVK